MKTGGLLLFLAILIAVGASFIFWQVNQKPPENSIEYQSGSLKKEAVEKAQANAPNPGTKKESLPDPLHPSWPEEIALVHNLCADLRVPEYRKQVAPGADGRAGLAPQFPQEIFRGDPSKKAVALTIDTGVGGADGIEQILRLAQYYDITLTFFLTGCWVLENPELTQQIAREGHSIANHTLTHLNLGTASDQQARRELGETQRILQETLGWQPVLFRKPQYAGGERITQLAGEYGMVSVQGWPDFGDTTGWRSGTTSQHVEALVKAKTAPGALWVFHNLSLADLAALEEIIRFHIIEGYDIVPVEEMVR